jgi:hypothetical protein
MIEIQHERRLSPLVLSAHASTPSAWAELTAEPKRFATAPCAFCGQFSCRWQEEFHLDGDHENNAPDNVVATCLLCHLVQHLDRPRIEEEATLIWLPEMSQRALIALARTIHLKLREAGEPVDAAIPSFGSAESYAHLRARRELLVRATIVKTRLGTSSPRELDAAMRALPPAIYAQREELLGGVRLLPLGRLHHGDHDVYPDILATWASLEGATGRKERRHAETQVS